MIDVKSELINLIQSLPQDKLEIIMEYANDVKNDRTPLDAFDYFLARKAESHSQDDNEAIPIEQAAAEMGINLYELQNNYQKRSKEIHRRAIETRRRANLPSNRKTPQSRRHKKLQGKEG